MKHLLILFLFFYSVNYYSQNTLFIPPVLSGTEFEIDILDTSHQFVPGIDTPTWGFNGSFLGPTLILQKNDLVNFTIHNQLEEHTTVHWHGLNVPSTADGGATTHHHIMPGATVTTSFEVLDRAGTYWYHPHPHENTETHVVRGLAGLLIIKDDEEAALELPRTYGVDDIPLIIQDKTFDSTMTIVETGLSHVMMVNGTLDAEFEAPEQVVRFRALNGSPSRHYMLGLSDDSNLIQISSDGGLLENPITLQRIMLSPGERAEFLVDFSGRNGDTLYLNSFAPEMPEGAAGQGLVVAPNLPGADSELNGVIFPIMKIVVGDQTENPVTTIPENQLSILPPMPDTTGIGITRVLTIESPNNGAGGPFYFNEESYVDTIMNQIVSLGETEVWLIRNQSLIGHPFHLHGGSYYMLERNGETPPENEQGLKDVWHVELGESIKIVVRFDTYANDSLPYMYHCHMLGHEDGGLMGNVLVVDSDYIGIVEKPFENNLNFSLYPNPTTDYFTVKSDKVILSKVRLEIFSILGERIFYAEETEIGMYKKTIDTSDFPSGIWFVRLTVDNNVSTKKIIINNK